MPLHHQTSGNVLSVEAHILLYMCIHTGCNIMHSSKPPEGVFVVEYCKPQTAHAPRSLLSASGCNVHVEYGNASQELTATVAAVSKREPKQLNFGNMLNNIMCVMHMACIYIYMQYSSVCNTRARQTSPVIKPLDTQLCQTLLNTRSVLVCPDTMC